MMGWGEGKGAGRVGRRDRKREEEGSVYSKKQIPKRETENSGRKNKQSKG